MQTAQVGYSRRQASSAAGRRRRHAGKPQKGEVQRHHHRQYKHPSKPGKVTIAGHPSVDAAPKTLKSILEQAGLKR
jgi:hypothetical protein